jgi:hypothetical protein
MNMKKASLLSLLFAPQLVFACGGSDSAVVLVFIVIAVGICSYVLKEVWESKIARILGFSQLGLVVLGGLGIAEITTLPFPYATIIVQYFIPIALLFALGTLVWGIIRWVGDLSIVKNTGNVSFGTACKFPVSRKTKHTLLIGLTFFPLMIIVGLFGYVQQTLCLDGKITTIPLPQAH